MWLMASLILAIISVISLFFVLIFTTVIVQQKKWSYLYLSLTILFLFLMSITFFTGLTFAWYTWMSIVWSLCFALIIPTLAGLALTIGLQIWDRKWSNWIAIIYIVFLAVIGTIFYRTYLTYEQLVGLDKFAILNMQHWKDEPIYFWMMGIPSIVLIVIALLLLLRTRLQKWLWIGLSGFVFYIFNQFLRQEVLGDLGIAVILTLFLSLLIVSGRHILKSTADQSVLREKEHQVPHKKVPHNKKNNETIQKQQNNDNNSNKPYKQKSDNREAKKTPKPAKSKNKQSRKKHKKSTKQRKSKS